MKLKLEGIVTVWHYRNGNLLSKQIFKNAITNEGKNAILDIMFNADLQLTSWYAGISDDMTSGNVNIADTMASKSWTEFTDYSEATREVWNIDSAGAVSQYITNANSLMEFTINITGTSSISGCFIASDSTKGGSTGTLWATGPFVTALDLGNTDNLKIQYKVNAA